ERSSFATPRLARVSTWCPRVRLRCAGMRNEWRSTSVQPVRLRFLPWDEWRQHFSEQEVAHTREHIPHSPNCRIEKARRWLGYEPRYTSLAAVQEAIGAPLKLDSALFVLDLLDVEAGDFAEVVPSLIRPVLLAIGHDCIAQFLRHLQTLGKF